MKVTKAFSKRKDAFEPKFGGLVSMQMQSKSADRVTAVKLLARPAPAQPPVKPTPLPQGPWEHLAADLLGPLPTGEFLLVTVDYDSRYFDVDVMRSTTSKAVVSCIHFHFARHGIPFSIRTDNGPQFVPEEFFGMKEMGVQHHRNMPLWPSANGQVERHNSTHLKSLRISHGENRLWRVELKNFLLVYLLLA